MEKRYSDKRVLGVSAGRERSGWGAWKGTVQNAESAPTAPHDLFQIVPEGMVLLSRLYTLHNADGGRGHQSTGGSSYQGGAA